MPLIRELDPSAGPLEFFGAEVRRWRTAAGLSQEQLGQRVGYSGAQVGKVETGERAPSQDSPCRRALPPAFRAHTAMRHPSLDGERPATVYHPA